MARRIRASAVSSDFINLDPAERDERNVELVRDYIAGLLAAVLPDSPDLVVLPEVCDRPDNFEMPRRIPYYERRGALMLDFISETARRHRCWIVYPTERRDASGAWRNSAYLVDRDGAIAGIYDKMFVTPSQMHEEGFSCATETPLFTTDFGTVGMAICFDLNFPALLEAYCRLRPDLLVFPSHFHGSFLAEYWARSTRAWLVGAIARHDCFVVSPAGRTVAASGPGRRFLSETINLDRCLVHCDWEELGRLDTLKRSNGPGVLVADAGSDGTFLVTSERDGATAVEMARAAGLELLDDHVRSVEEASPWRAR